MSDDRGGKIGRRFFDLQLDRPATKIFGARNVAFLPFIRIAHVNEQGVAAFGQRPGGRVQRVDGALIIGQGPVGGALDRKGSG